MIQQVWQISNPMKEESELSIHDGCIRTLGITVGKLFVPCHLSVLFDLVVQDNQNHHRCMALFLMVLNLQHHFLVLEDQYFLQVPLFPFLLYFQEDA